MDTFKKINSEKESTLWRKTEKEVLSFAETQRESSRCGRDNKSPCGRRIIADPQTPTLHSVIQEYSGDAGIFHF